MEESSELLDGEPQELSQDIKGKFGHLFLKLESNVSNKCIDEIVHELQFTSTSGPLLRDVVVSTLKSHNCDLDPAIVSDLVKNICDTHPISTTLGTGGPFCNFIPKKRIHEKAIFGC